MTITQLVTDVCSQWPEHKRFLDTALPQLLEIDGADELAGLVATVVADRFPEVIDGYKWMCSMMLEEELIFRRTGAYRFSSFSEVEALVYTNAPMMASYLDGLLLSQAIWPNHAQAMGFYRKIYLPSVRDARHHLEIGPGHGLLLYFATRELTGTQEGWDISPAAIDRTRGCLQALGADMSHLSLKQVDFFATEAGGGFDSIVCSEVLEHLEDPLAALCRIADLLAADGRAYINVPLNSPSIDHIYLFRTPEEITDMVAAAGLRVAEEAYFPAMGYTLKRSLLAQTTVTCSLVVRPS